MTLWGGRPPPDLDLLVLDVDGVLFDTRPSFYEAARVAAQEAGGTLSDEEIATFKAAGGFNDDWEMARAAAAIGRWRAATDDDRPLAKLLAAGGGLARVLEFAPDPGDLTARCEALYEERAAHEIPMVTPSLLQAVGRRVRLAACTGRTAPQARQAFRRLEVEPDPIITCEIARKPAAEAVLPTLEGVRSALFLGDNIDDLKAAQAARLHTDVALTFAWCLDPQRASGQAADRVLRLGADLATSGPNPLLRAILEECDANR